MKVIASQFIILCFFACEPGPPKSRQPEQSAKQNRLEDTRWGGQLENTTQPYLLFGEQEVILSFPLMTELKGQYRPTNSGAEIHVRGPSGNYGLNAELEFTGSCIFGHKEHAYEFQDFLDCQWKRIKPKSLESEFQQISIPPRFFDPKSHKPQGQLATVNGTKIITLGLQESHTRADVFIRKGPSVSTPRIEGLTSCIADNPDRYEAGSRFLLIGRTLDKVKLLDTEDYWYYGVYWITDCAWGSSGRGWIYGGLLE